MAGAIEELFSVLKIVPDENNLQNISEHLEGFNSLVQNFTDNLKELAMRQLADDTGAASENLKKAGINVDALKQDLPKAEKSLSEAEKSAGGFKNEMKGTKEEMKHVMKDAQLLANNIMLVQNKAKEYFQMLIQNVKQFASESINAANNFQKMKISLQGVFGDDQMADDFISQLQKMEKASAFSAETLAGAAQQLIPNFDEPKQAMSMLNDIQRLALGDQAKLNGIASAFIQIGNSAQITQRELKMFRNASGGLNIGKQLEKDLGKSKEQIDKMLKDGLISKNQVADAIRNISAGLGNKPEELGNTFDAVFSRVKSSIQQNLGLALMPLADALKPLAEALEKLDFSSIANSVQGFANALTLASPMIFNIFNAMLNLAEVLMAVASPFAELFGWVMNFIANVPGLNNLFIGLLGILGMKGLAMVIRVLIQKIREMAAAFTALSANAATAGTSVGNAGIVIANTGRAAQNATGQIVNVGLATKALNTQASATPLAMVRMVGGLRKVAFGVRALGRTVKATLVGMGPAGWIMLGLGAASEIYNYIQDKKDDVSMDEFDTTLPKDQKLPEWEFEMNNNISNNFQLDREGKSNMSKEMLETAIKEQTRSLFNMEIMRVLEASQQGGSVSV